MPLGHDLIKQQLFFRREMIERVYWFIHLRWAVVGAGLVTSWILHFLEPKFPVIPISFVLLFIALYNVIFLILYRRLIFFKPQEVEPFAVFAHAQIGVDLLALFIMIYFTGGIYSPLLLFVIFHIILAGILLTPVSCFVYGVLVLLATGCFVMFQNAGTLETPFILFQSPTFDYGAEFFQIWGRYLIFAATIMITAFLVTTIKLSLRTKGRELLKISRELDMSNAKLTALYEMAKEMGLCSDLQTLMDTATRNATRIMGVRGCSIKLLDEDTKTLKFASTYGLSEDYIAKGSIQIEKSPINRRIIEGSFYSIGKIDEKDYFQYPEDVRKEGIASMICLPLRVEKRIFGVFCVYSNESFYFEEKDIEFFSLMTDLAAIAIENLRSALTKFWFMMKASHQLRSPLNTIYSMLKPLIDGYFGPISENQKDIIEKCVKRIKILGELINDLLKLGEKKSESARPVLYPVDLTKIMHQLADFYQTRATEKGVEINFRIQEDIPRVLANEKIIDELFTNLLSNAVKYTPPGGKVEVLLSKENENRILFEVTDTGIGLSEEEIPKLFTEFFRTESAKALVEEGTGLGLAIVKEILDRLGGTITVESKVGRGSRFSCLLPSLPSS